MPIIVDLALRQCPTLASLERTTRVISNFLRQPPNLLLSEACELGSVDLLDWIWSSSCTNPDDRTPGWSLTNYLRSDPYYHRWQFTKSLYVAVKRGDMEIVGWLFAHFVGCEAPTDVVSAAARCGHLHVLRYLWQHRSRDGRGPNCRYAVVSDGDRPMRESKLCTVQFDRGCYEGSWGEPAITKAVENGQLVECLTLGMRLGWYDRQIAIKHALNIGQDELVEKLLPEGSSVLDYAYNCSRSKILREMVRSGRFQWDEDHATIALINASKEGSVELVQDIFQLHSPLQEEHSRWEKAFCTVMGEASSYGNLKVLQWLLEHSLVRDLKEKMKKGTSHTTFYTLFQAAVKGGHIEVMQYLFDTNVVDVDGYTTQVAIQKNQPGSVKWLADHIWIDHPTQFGLATAEAVEYGRLEVLEFLRSWKCPQTDEGVGNKRSRASDSSFTWDSDLIYWAASGGHVEALKWLQEHRSDEKSDARAMDTAASRGYFDILKWLHANRTEGCTSDAMYRAAQNGNFEMVKWLYENRPKSRTRAALVQAIRFGHVRMADWLRKKYPDYTISEHSVPEHKGGLVCGYWQSDNVLETLLFLHEFYPSVFSPDFFRILRECYTLKYDEQCHTTELVLGWVDANYPSTTETTE